VSSLAELVRKASPEAVALAEEILRSDIENRAWSAQIGPCLSRRAVARLLGKTEQAVAQDQRLFWFRNGDGRIAYPIAQFDGTTVVSGVHEVVTILSSAGDDELEILAWLSAPKPAFGGRSAFEELHLGDQERVIALARQWAELDAAS
jgi:hypothetical protein